LKEAASTLLRAKQNALARYDPYPKQEDFHEAGLNYSQRALLAGNQSGKTYSAGFEVAMHLTGRYPPWWKGKTWDRPTQWWSANQSNELTRDNPQRILLGEKDAWGTGSIPAECIENVTRSRGISDAADVVSVRHVRGGVSHIQFKAYEQGYLKWSGATLDGIWLDEEPPADIFSECIARTARKNGVIMLTVTPLLGMTEVIGNFYPHPNTDHRFLVMMQLEDCKHYDDAQIAEIIAGYRPHEREARHKGIPMLGSGRVFPIPEDDIKEDPVQKMPNAWARICGIDFGFHPHPTAVAWLAWDRDNDTFHLYDVYRQTEAVPAVHAAAIRARGGDIPLAWPHDAYKQDPGSGESLADQYRRLDVNMLPSHALNAPGVKEHRMSVEAGVQEILQYMQQGRFKVARHLQDFWAEFRVYHRKDGKIVKEHDDVISAVRYAFMCRRFARPIESRRPVFTGTVGMDYDPLNPAGG
jgi:phage terminase large subunit-like protein